MIRTVTRASRRAAWTSRAFHASPCQSTNNALAKDDVREALRALLQHTAQPVSILTMKSATATENLETSEPYHGATLSSFSSISFHPFPIVSFALQLPSRSADALQSHFAQSSSSSSTTAAGTPTLEPHLIINILSSTQADLARRFSRTDLYPKPFLDLDHDRTTPQKYTLTNEGIPKFTDSLGALSCSLIASVPLNVASEPHRLAHAMEAHVLPSKSEVRPGSASSMLYLARVLRVEDVGRRGGAEAADRDGVEADEWPHPLLYHRKAYGTVKPLIPPVSA